MRAISLAIAGVLVCALLFSCSGSLLFRERAVLASPVGPCSVQIEQEPIWQEARVNLMCRGRPARRILDVRHELYIFFAHAYWTPDNGTVAVLICGTGYQRFAYSISSGRQVPFGQFKALLERDLATSYAGVLPRSTPIESLSASACNVEPLTNEYRRRYPKGRTD